MRCAQYMQLSEDEKSPGIRQQNRLVLTFRERLQLM